MLPEPPQPPPQPPEREPDELLESVANLDTARMTLRWALERMRMLEAGHAEMRELLKAAAAGREEAVRELEKFRLSVDERVSRLAERERFVAEMQGILNNLFKGELPVEEFVRRRQALEKTQEDLEDRVRKRLADAEEAHKREVAEHARLLGEMEATYTQSLAEAQKRYRDQLSEIEDRHRAELEAERAKAVNAREEALAEVRLQGDQFHQRALLLEVEHSTRRKAFEEDLGRLQNKLLEEHRQAQAREAQLHELLRGRIESEKRQLEAELALRDKALAEAQSIAGCREEEARRRAFEEFERERAAFEERLQALRRQAAAENERLSQEIAALQAGLAERDLRLGQERERLLAAQQELLRRAEERHAAELEALRASLEQWRQRGLQAQAGALEEYDRRNAEREQDLRAGHRKELEVVRAEHASRIESLYDDIALLRRRHEAELKLRAEEAQRLQSSWRAAAEDREHRAAEETAALQEQHRKEIERLDEELRRGREEFDAQRQALAREIEKVRADSSATHAEALQRIESLFTESAKRHAQALQSVEASRQDQERALRAELQKTRADFEAERAQLLEERARVRREDLVNFEEALHGIERFFLERNSRRLRETAEQIEELQQSHSRLSAAQMQESHQETERLLRDSLRLKSELAQRPPKPSDIGEGALSALRMHLPMFAWLLAAAALAAAFSLTRLFGGVVDAEHSVPFSHPTSLFWEGNTLWAADASEEAVYRLRFSEEAGLSVDRRIPVQGVRLTSLTRVRGDFYAIDGNARVITRLRPQGEALVADRSWPAPGPRPSAIHFDGRDLWTADAQERKLYRHALDESLQVLETRPAAQAATVLSSDGENLWTADDAGFWLSQNLRYAQSARPYHWLTLLSEPPVSATCLAWRGRKLWIGREGAYQLLERPAWRLRPGAASIDTPGVID